MKRKNRGGLHAVAAMAMALVSSWGCGAADESDGMDEKGTVEQALAPPGSNAQVVGSAIPTTLYPGERRVVSVTMRNTGAASPANDWTTSGPSYGLQSQTSAFNWGYANVPSRVPVGSDGTFTFVLTAPPSSQTLKARVSAVGLGAFGETLSLPITVDPATKPQWGCSLVSSTLPAQLAPGQNQYATVTVRNTGTATWAATGLKLATRDVPANLWGATSADLTASVAPGDTATFGFNLRAPSTPGTYAFQRDMKDYAGIGDFRPWGFCVTQNIVVGGTSPLNAAVVSHDFVNTTIEAYRPYTVHVTMQNTGSEAWTAGSSYVLYSLNTPVNAFTRTLATIDTATPSGASANLTLYLNGPSVPGAYRQKWQMRKLSGPGAGAAFFGAVIDVPVTVLAASPDDSAVVSHDVPRELLIGEFRNITVVMKNTGIVPWPRLDYRLTLLNASEGWTTLLLSDPMTDTPVGANATFTTRVQAPFTAGEYRQKWRMEKQTNGTWAPFGALVDVPVTVKLPDAPALAAEMAQHSLKASVLPGESMSVTVIMKNLGFETWTRDGNYVLASVNDPVDAYGVTQDAFPLDVAFTQQATFAMDLTAPSAPGEYRQKWQMRKLTGPGAGFFGPLIDVPLTVRTPVPGSHQLTVNTGACFGMGATINFYGHTLDVPPFQLQETCPDNTTCAYEVYDGEEFELWCDGGMTQDPVFSIAPAINSSGRCDAVFDPFGHYIHCDVFGTSQSYTVNVGFDSNPCFPETCF